MDSGSPQRHCQLSGQSARPLPPQCQRTCPRSDLQALGWPLGPFRVGAVSPGVPEVAGELRGAEAGEEGRLMGVHLATRKGSFVCIICSSFFLKTLSNVKQNVNIAGREDSV